MSYEVKDGVIISPGKFEGCPEWAPYFWDISLDGFSDNVNGSFMVEVLEPDKKLYKVLENVREVFLMEDNNGFIYTKIKFNND